MKQLHGSCKTCKYYDVPDIGGVAEGGICRESSPQTTVYVVPQQDKLSGRTTFVPMTGSNFPSVGETCWCGKWAPGIIPMNG